MEKGTKKKPAFGRGDFVYLVTDPDQLLRQVIAIIYYDDFIMYRLTCGEQETDHHPSEISTQKNPIVS
jgi:hypothetical protein